MSNPRQDQFARPSRRNRLRFVTVGLLSTGLLSIGSAMAWADDGSIVLDFVRHGQSVDNAAGIIDTQPPGTELTPTGEDEANAVATAIQNEYGNSIAGLFASEEIRTQETAAPLAEALGGNTAVEILPGLNEIPAGTFEGDPTNSLEGILYLLAPLSWVFGDVLVPDVGDPSVNGVTFDESFGGAVQTIYDGTVGSAGSGTPTDVAFSSEGAIAVWTMMNVNNPDFSVLLQEVVDTGGFLPNTGQVVIEGSPGNWTLVSYDGTAVPQDPGLGTELFVDFRNLIEAPQFAGYDIYQALLTGDSTTIENALQTGLGQVDTALAQFPVAVFDDILGALTGGTSAAATDFAGLGDLGALVGEAFAGI
jgi:Histidine phosphatase superfamily (branch 1)